MADGACADSYVRRHKLSFMEVPHGDRARGGVPQEAVEKRKKKDRRWKSIIISRISDSQLEYVLNHQTPKAIWQALHKVFERKNIASRLHLKKKLLSWRHESGTNL